MNDMGGGCQIQPEPAGLERNNKERNHFIFLKLADKRLSSSDFSIALQNQTGTPEYGFEEGCERRSSLAELRKHQDLFLPRGDRFRDFAKACEFSAVAFCPVTITK